MGIVIAPLHLSAASAATTAVSTSAGLTAALAAAVPGQVIQLADGTYTGKFIAAAAGTSSAPITLQGSRNAILTTGSASTAGYGLHVTGANWNLKGFSITNSAKGVVLDNSDNSIVDGLDVGNIGQEAIHIRKSSTNVTVRNSIVHDTGLSTPAYGEGIYIGTAKSNWATIMGSSTTMDESNNALIENNIIRNTSAEGLDIKEGTVGGRILGNTFDRSGYSGANYGDSWVDVKGNGYTLSGNTGKTSLLDAFQVHSVLTGWGINNTFVNNTVVSGIPGFEVSSSSSPKNTVACKLSGAAKGLSDIPCVTGITAPAPAPEPAPAPAHLHRRPRPRPRRHRHRHQHQQQARSP